VTVEHWFFYPLAVLTVLSALGVVLARNPLYSALYLVVSFFFLSAIFILLGAHLVGILQIIVYAGAIMVLFLFVIMLLAIGDAELGRRRITALKVLAAISTVGLVGAALKAFGLQRGVTAPLIMWLRLDYQPLPADFGTAASVARLLFYDFLLPFEAVSLLLLVAIAGAVVVAKGRI
jgi:NADH-quinone oxidoreductase subunit J